MILWLFGILLLLSFGLIVVGLSKQEESAQALTGFFFLFLLGLVLLTNNLEYKSGESTITQYSHFNFTHVNGPPDPDHTHQYLLNQTREVTYDIYTKFSNQDSYYFGFWLCVASAIGMIMTLVGLKGGFADVS